MNGKEETPPKSAAVDFGKIISRLKTMSWESASYWTIWATVVVAIITFVVGLVTVYVQYRAGLEKDAKAEIQATKLANLELKRIEAETKLAELEGKNLETERKLEAEKKSRGKLEDYVKPLSLLSTTKSKERLGVYKGTPYILELIPDNDVAKTANLVDSMLQELGWTRIGYVINNYQMTWGVQTSTRGFKVTEHNFRQPRAANELASYFEANGLDVSDIRVNIPGFWDLAEQTFGAANIPDGTVKISVGPKPPTYFWMKSADETTEAYRKLQPAGQKNPVINDAFLKEAKEWSERITDERIETLKKEWGIIPG